MSKEVIPAIQNLKPMGIPMEEITSVPVDKHIVHLVIASTKQSARNMENSTINAFGEMPHIGFNIEKANPLSEVT